ncbi:MAG: two component, sigma54 specific, transcriptional regulator, Fis family, partial [Verrucomicrobiales bacterium]|nr:two component, sigma54 specific, transcriptional regulator, Fis family [Verrucomicrobiales bacterium]
DMKKVVSYEPLLESEDYDIGIIGRSEPMQKVFKLIGQLAASDATALVTGESGTGKELVARAIYHHSKRCDKPFLAINCAAIPENLLESELFGHEKGSFTGATAQRIGKFEQCNGGTIFLDEIGDMSLTTQTKILRVLQSGSFERVGGNQPVQVNVRVIAATNKPLEEAVAAKQFREDLFYRLNVVRIQMPALRERREDIPLLVEYFLKRNSHGKGTTAKVMSKDALALLESFHWPGNVRELQNVLERAFVVSKGDVILVNDFGPALSRPGVIPTIASPSDTGGANDTPSALAKQLFLWARTNPKFKVVPAVERELIINALHETSGNQVQAAKLLGITRATLRKRIEKFGITQQLTIT